MASVNMTNPPSTNGDVELITSLLGQHQGQSQRKGGRRGSEGERSWLTCVWRILLQISPSREFSSLISSPSVSPTCCRTSARRAKADADGVAIDRYPLCSAFAAVSLSTVDSVPLLTSLCTLSCSVHRAHWPSPSHCLTAPPFPFADRTHRLFTPPVLDPVAFETLISHFMNRLFSHTIPNTPSKKIDVVVGLDARGFLFGPIIAARESLSASNRTPGDAGYLDRPARAHVRRLTFPPPPSAQVSVLPSCPFASPESFPASA